MLKFLKNLDCLTCANCCITTGTPSTHTEIYRIATNFKIKPCNFTDRFLKIDQDGELQQISCEFLGTDNYCSIYRIILKAHIEYPDTNRKKIYQIDTLTVANTAVCPAVF